MKLARDLERGGAVVRDTNLLTPDAREKSDEARCRIVVVVDDENSMAAGTLLSSRGRGRITGQLSADLLRNRDRQAHKEFTSLARTLARGDDRSTVHLDESVDEA